MDTAQLRDGGRGGDERHREVRNHNALISCKVICSAIINIHKRAMQAQEDRIRCGDLLHALLALARLVTVIRRLFARGCDGGGFDDVMRGPRARERITCWDACRILNVRTLTHLASRE